MIHVTFLNKAFRYFLFAFIGGLFSLSANAQGRNHERAFNRPGRESSHNNDNRQPRMQSSPQRIQNPATFNQHSNNWKHDINRPEPRHLQVNNASPRRPGNSYNNNHFQNRNNNRPYPASYHNNSRPGWGGWGNNRRPVYNPHNPSWRYSYLPRRNSIITSFAFPFTTINFGGYGYRYCDGVYYRPYNNVYRVVAPPIGIYINVLPTGCRRIYVNDYPYYYYNGTYYDQYEDSYRVVAPPVGAVVESIPEGYETVVIDGETYYKVDDIQYKPVIQDNGEIWYQVIKVG